MKSVIIALLSTASAVKLVHPPNHNYFATGMTDGTESLAQGSGYDPHFNDPFHPVLDDALWPGHVKELLPIAGTDVTDQISRTVALSGNVVDAIPSWKRDIIGENPKSFLPDYDNVKGSPSAGDIAEKEAVAAGKALDEAAAKKAAE